MTKKAETEPAPKTGLELLREPFPAHQISKLPKPTKAQTDAVKANFRAGIRCEQCGAWHHPDVVHLDYVGHAALTKRLLDADINWSWEPLSLDDHGLPSMDRNNGMWIKLTVCGVTRLGYGSPDGKTGGDATKEVIGDALRNAAMRFGAALDLWHKGDLHGDEHAEEEPAPDPKPQQKQAKPDAPEKTYQECIDAMSVAKTIEALREVFANAWKAPLPQPDKDGIKLAYEQKKAALSKPTNLADGFVPPDFDNINTENKGGSNE
jgi:hypothetical protein